MYVILFEQSYLIYFVLH